GQITFTNLRILSKGTYNIIATSAGITSVTSTSSASIINYAYSISLTSSTLSPSANFDFTLTALLKGEDSNTFTGSCTVAFTENSGAVLYPASSIMTSTGSAILTIYMTAVGSKT